jgi:hypothetical protein
MSRFLVRIPPSSSGFRVPDPLNSQLRQVAGRGEGERPQVAVPRITLFGGVSRVSPVIGASRPFGGFGLFAGPSGPRCRLQRLQPPDLRMRRVAELPGSATTPSAMDPARQFVGKS